MTTAPASQKVQVPDVAAQICYAMRSMGISPIPRNYELFYEAYIGSNPKLTKDLAALGNKATQDELDAIGEEFFEVHRNQIIDGAHTKVATELEGLLRLLKQEQNSLESYNRLLGETYSRINTKSVASVDLLRSAIGVLSAATGDTMSTGQQIAQNVEATQKEMDLVRKELDEYKRIANTDSLTRLSNRRAFDEKLAGLFDVGKPRTLIGLMVADIDHFKKINDNYGHPVGDKILATVANVIRTNVRKDVFVARTGGEEFAVIVEGNTADEFNAIAERIRRALESTPFKNSKTGINYGPVTMSIGYCMANDANDPSDLYQKADIALYCAKNVGRNRVIPYEEGMKKDMSKSWLLYRR